MVLITIFEGVILEQLATIQLLIAQLSLNLFYLVGGVVDSVMKRLKGNNLIVTLLSNNFGRWKFFFKIDHGNSNIPVWKSKIHFIFNRQIVSVKWTL